MGRLAPHGIVEWLTDPTVLGWALWTGLALVTVALLLMMRTRWGQSNPLRKCVVLSIIAHLLMAGYATTIQIVAASARHDEEPAIRIASVEDVSDDEAVAPDRQPSRPWDRPRDPAPIDLDEPVPQRAETTPEEITREHTAPEEGLDDLPAIEPTPAAEAALPAPAAPDNDLAPREHQPVEAAEAPEAPAPKRQESAVEPVPTLTEFQRPHPHVADQVDPGKATSDEMPSTVLEQPSPPPRLATTPESTTPESALPDTIDAPSRALEQMTRPTAEDVAGGAVGLDQPPGPSGDDGTNPEDGAQPEGGPAPLAEVVRPPNSGGLVPVDHGEEESPVAPYEHRVAPNRLVQAERFGGNAGTEAAVEEALEWLARVQSEDGRWEAKRHGAGREQNVAGHNRGGAGADADSGVTGLALLAYLGAGYTHEQGKHKETVSAGIDYLIRQQRADGHLGANASTYAQMYCHGMAALAISEALAMTGDSRLRKPVEQAVRFTLSAQHVATGGWRYRPGDLGDTSQLGWQLMALKSAEFAGIAIPKSSRDGMIRFLKSVSLGRHGGLAAYRPLEQASRSMTAEALVCRQFLGMERTNPASSEAADYLLGELPGDGAANFYYWYYATLGMFQLQGPHWERWNDALQQALVKSQHSKGDLAGSWDPDPVWGNYGGRIYSTALGALCLEVYYRFLPLYGEVARADGRKMR